MLRLLSAVVACGGAVAPDGTSSGSGGTSSGGSSGSTPTQPGHATNPTPTASGTTGTPPAPPTTWASTAQGCGNFQIYVPDATQKKYILVQADKDKLAISQLGDTATVDLATSTSAFVQLDTYAAPAVNPIYCNDAPTSVPTHSSTAWAGSATFTISGLPNDTNDTYQVDVTLRGVVVLQPDETYLELPDLTFEGVTVGWFAG